jgi:hypothetical protein
VIVGGKKYLPYSNSDLAEDPDMFVQFYEMASAMDGLYEFMFLVGEDWNLHVKAWLIRFVTAYDL